jgi:hypothetical protein
LSHNSNYLSHYSNYLSHYSNYLSHNSNYLSHNSNYLSRNNNYLSHKSKYLSHNNYLSRERTFVALKVSPVEGVLGFGPSGAAGHQVGVHVLELLPQSVDFVLQTHQPF